MSNDIVRHQPSTADKMEQARLLADASLIPATYKKNPANVYVAIEYGEALGIHPMVALSEINVIQGTPALSASLMASLARNAGHKVRVTGDNNGARCVIIRADDPDFEYVTEWDVAKAKAAGLWGKGHWAKDPGTMMKWRSISEGVRMACSEVLGGLKYSPEEVASFTTPAPRDTPQVPQEPTTIRRKAAEVVTVEEVVEEPQEATQPVPAPSVQEQWAAIGEWLQHAEPDASEWSQILDRVGKEVGTGRDVFDPADLTYEEADAVLARFAQGGAR